MKEEQVEPLKDWKLPVAGATLVTTEIAAHMMNGGALGVGAGLFVAGVMYFTGDKWIEAARETFPSLSAFHLPEVKTREKSGRSIKDKLFGIFPEEEEYIEGSVEGEEDEDELFTLEQKQNPLPFERLDMRRIIENIPFNSYKVYLGRSVLLEKNPARSVCVESTHLKLIGASQKGKSSMAACIMKQLVATNDEEHLLLAILDLEDKTGRLFENDPHIAQFQMGNVDVKMHARNEDKVLEYLGYINELMKWRYTLSEEEVSNQPLLVVYIEEFLDLKKYFKLRMETAKKDEKEQAEQEYAELIEYISKIARRGLKARIQLLLCAQVDYRDNDLVEALANVTSGMCFAVKPTAAQAAGFSQVDYLQKVYADKVVGMAAAEFSGCKDIVLAPDFPLKQLLLEREQRLKNRRNISALPKREFKLNAENEDYTEEDKSPRNIVEKQGKRERIIQRGAQLKLEGLNQANIAEKLGLTPWTIRPYWDEIVEEAERLQDEEYQEDEG